MQGIIHIGAHYGQEYASWVAQGVKNFIFFEPVPVTYNQLVSLLPHTPNIQTFNMALGNFTGEIEMFIETANQGMSSSVLEPKVHLTQYPFITFPEKLKVKIDKLDNIGYNRRLYDAISLDVQGYELEVLKGAEKSLAYINELYTEVNREELYAGCALIEEIDAFLEPLGLYRTDVNWCGGTYGDALYTR